MSERVSRYLSLLQDGLGLGLLGGHHWTLLGVAAILELDGLTERSQSSPVEMIIQPPLVAMPALPPSLCVDSMLD